MLRRLRARLLARLRALLTEIRVEAATPVPERSGLFGAYVGGNRVLIAPQWGGRLLVPGDDLSHLPDLMVDGLYDRPFTAYVQRFVRPGDTVIDVGANVGIFTVLAAYQVWEHGRVIAYEPSPRNVAVLRDNVSLNWLSDRVTIVPRAAGAAAGEATFLAPRRFGGAGSLQPIEHLLRTADRADEIDRVQVEVEPLDVHLGSLPKIDLVKIDVEGGEEQVLRGMERLLAAGAVEAVSFELSRPLLGTDWEPLVGRLRDLAAAGWTFATIDAGGEPVAAELAGLLERGVVSQVLMRQAANAVTSAA